MSLRCVVVTPEKAFLDEEATFIVVPMYDGELGVADGRLPLIGRLGYGELRVTQGTLVKHFYVDGGFVQVRNNVVTVLTSKAIPAKDIKVEEARNVLTRHAVAATPAEQEANQKAEQRARAQLRIAEKLKE
jgi:F-type H+-transporting ATPase subunit epsilon